MYLELIQGHLTSLRASRTDEDTVKHKSSSLIILNEACLKKKNLTTVQFLLLDNWGALFWCIVRFFRESPRETDMTELLILPQNLVVSGCWEAVGWRGKRKAGNCFTFSFPTCN